MRAVAVRFLLYSQACLYGGLVACILLRPAGLSANDGVSYYGIYARTILPYSIAIIGSAVFSWLAARSLSDGGDDHYIRRALVVFSVLLLGIALTPYSVSNLMDWLHTGFGSALFSLQLVLTGWLTFWRFRTWQTICLWTLEFLSGVASAAYLNPTSGYLMESQLIFQMAFGILLIYILPRQTTPEKNPSKS